MSFQPAQCPKCGGSLQIPDHLDIVKCMYCGVDIIVREVLRIEISSNTRNLLELADTALESGQYEVAYSCYSRLLEQDIQHSAAWFGRGLAAGGLSTLANTRLAEAMKCFSKCLENCDESDKHKYSAGCCTASLSLGAQVFGRSVEHLAEFKMLDGTWDEHVERSFEVLEILDFAVTCDPENIAVYQSVNSVCNTLLLGVYCPAGDSNGGLFETSVFRGLPQHLRDEVLRRKFDAISKAKAIDPETKISPHIGKEPCFIATAATGRVYHPYVVVLREFRESLLAASPLGRCVIFYYNLFGPHLAMFIRTSVLLRSATFWFLVFPAAWMARAALYASSTYNSTSSRGRNRC